MARPTLGQPSRPGHLGIEQVARPVAELGQAGQVLRRGVQHGLGPGERSVQSRQVGTRHRVDEDGPGILPPELHEEGAVPVPEA